MPARRQAQNYTVYIHMYARYVVWRFFPLSGRFRRLENLYNTKSMDMVHKFQFISICLCYVHVHTVWHAAAIAGRAFRLIFLCCSIRLNSKCRKNPSSEEEKNK